MKKCKQTDIWGLFFLPVILNSSRFWSIFFRWMIFRMLCDYTVFCWGANQMSRSQLQRFILSTQTSVNARLAHPGSPRPLPLFFYCLPISRPAIPIPHLSNALRISGQQNLSVSSSRKWKKEQGKPHVALTRRHVLLGVRWCTTPQKWQSPY